MLPIGSRCCKKFHKALDNTGEEAITSQCWVSVQEGHCRQAPRDEYLHGLPGVGGVRGRQREGQTGWREDGLWSRAGLDGVETEADTDAESYAPSQAEEPGTGLLGSVPAQ